MILWEAAAVDVDHPAFCLGHKPIHKRRLFRIKTGRQAKFDVIANLQRFVRGVIGDDGQNGAEHLFTGNLCISGSIDRTCKLWDVNSGKEIHTLLGHTAEIVSLNFNTDGRQVITGSFDHTIKLWDVGTGKCIHTLSGHHGEISSTQFNFSSELCISGSIDRTCKIWNVKTGQCLQTLRGHNDEILDVAFNATGPFKGAEMMITNVIVLLSLI